VVVTARLTVFIGTLNLHSSQKIFDGDNFEDGRNIWGKLNKAADRTVALPSEFIRTILAKNFDGDNVEEGRKF